MGCRCAVYLVVHDDGYGALLHSAAACHVGPDACPLDVHLHGDVRLAQLVVTVLSIDDNAALEGSLTRRVGHLDGIEVEYFSGNALECLALGSPEELQVAGQYALGQVGA